MKENMVYTLSDNKNYAIIKSVKVGKKVYFIASKLEDDDDQVVFLSENDGTVTFINDLEIITKIAIALNMEAEKIDKQTVAK